VELNRKDKEASEIHLPETGGGRHHIMEAETFSFEAIKPEPKSTSQRGCLGKSV